MWLKNWKNKEINEGTNGIINLEEADNVKMVVGVMKPDEHSYANYDGDHYFENTIVPVGESSPQNKKIDE